MDLLPLNLMSILSKLKRGSKSVQELVDAVYNTFKCYDMNNLIVSYAHLNSCFNEVIKIEGCNQYNSPHKKSSKKIFRGERVDVVDIDINEYNRLRQLVTDHFGRF